MKIDVDKVIADTLPWECEVTISGTAYKVPPPTLAAMDSLMKFQANKQLGERDAAKLIADLFEEPRPKLAEMGLPTVRLVTQAVTKYIHDYLSKKNGELLLTAAGLIPLADGTPGTSSRPSSSPAPESTTP